MPWTVSKVTRSGWVFIGKHVFFKGHELKRVAVVRVNTPRGISQIAHYERDRRSRSSRDLEQDVKRMLQSVPENLDATIDSFHLKPVMISSSSIISERIA